MVMKQFFKLVGNEFLRIFSNKVIVAIFFLAPVLYAVLVGYVYKSGKVSNLPIAVIDYDQTSLSSKFVDALDDNENIKVAKVYSSDFSVRKDVVQKDYACVVTIPKSFQADVLQRRYPEVTVDVNTGNILTANYASRGVQSVLATLNAGLEIETLKKQGISAGYAATRFEAFKVSINRLFNASSNYMEFLWPGTLGVVLQQVILLALALSFARDFEDKYFNKLVGFSKISLLHVTIKVIPFYILSIIPFATMAYMFSYFQIDMPILTLSMFKLCFAFATACIFLGLLVSVLLPNQLQATEILMLIATPSFIIGGFTWPLQEMNHTIQVVARAIPLTSFLEGFRKLVVYKAEYSDISYQIGVLGKISLFSFIATILILQLRIYLAGRTEKKAATTKRATN